MTGYIFYDQAGEIRLFMQCSLADAEQTTADRGYNFIEGQSAHPSAFFVADGMVQPKPSPGPYDAPDVPTEGETLADVQDRRWTQIKFQRDTAEASGFDTDIGRFDSDAVSQTKLIGIAVAAQHAPDEWQVTWTLQDNTSVALTVADVLHVNQCLFAHLNAVHEQGRSLREAIYSTDASIESVNGVAWKPSLPRSSPDGYFYRLFADPE